MSFALQNFSVAKKIAFVIESLSTNFTQPRSASNLFFAHIHTIQLASALDAGIQATSPRSMSSSDGDGPESPSLSTATLRLSIPLDCVRLPFLPWKPLLSLLLGLQIVFLLQFRPSDRALLDEISVSALITR